MPLPLLIPVYMLPLIVRVMVSSVHCIVPVSTGEVLVVADVVSAAGFAYRVYICPDVRAVE